MPNSKRIASFEEIPWELLESLARELAGDPHSFKHAKRLRQSSAALAGLAALRASKNEPLKRESGETYDEFGQFSWRKKFPYFIGLVPSRRYAVCARDDTRFGFLAEQNRARCVFHHAQLMGLTDG